MKALRKPNTAPVSGTMNANGYSSPFRAEAGIPVFVEISVPVGADFLGSVIIARSSDGGTTKRRATMKTYTGSAGLMFMAESNSNYTKAGFTVFNEPFPWEESQDGALWYVEITGYVSGTINYRLSQ